MYRHFKERKARASSRNAAEIAPSEIAPSSRNAETDRSAVDRYLASGHGRTLKHGDGRPRGDCPYRRELVEQWAKMGALRADAVPLPPALPPEVRGVCLGLVQDPSEEWRRASEVCWWKLPAPQARALFAVRDVDPQWPRLVATALAEWRISRPARPGARCARIVDGVCVGARAFFVLKPTGRRYSRSSIASMRGPFRELVRMGFFSRRQPPAGATPYVGHRRCGTCRRVLGTGCKCAIPGPVVQWSVGQSCYQAAMCGPSLATLARTDPRVRRELARWLPWLAREGEEREEAARVESALVSRPELAPERTADDEPNGPQEGTQAPSRPAPDD